MSQRQRDHTSQLPWKNLGSDVGKDMLVEPQSQEDDVLFIVVMQRGPVGQVDQPLDRHFIAHVPLEGSLGTWGGVWSPYIFF